MEDVVAVFPHFPQDFVQFGDQFSGPHCSSSPQAEGFVVPVLDGGKLGGDSAQADVWADES